MSERIYSLVLRLYPRPFRKRYADEMLRVFRERLRDERSLRVWLDVIADAAVSIPQQHFTARAAYAKYPSARTRLQRAMAAAIAPILILMLLLGMGMGASIAAAFLVGGIWPLTAMVMLAGASVTGCWRARRIRRSIVVDAEVNGDSITVACPVVGMEPQTLRRDEVIGLEIIRSAGMRIRAADPNRDLWIPANAPAFSDVQARVSVWAPVTIKPLFDLASVRVTAWDTVIRHVVAVFFPLSFALVWAAMSAALIVPAARRRPIPWWHIASWTGPVVIVLVRWLR